MCLDSINLINLIFDSPCSVPLCHFSAPYSDLHPACISSTFQVRVCLGHYASRGLKDPLRGKDMYKLVGIEITDSATIRYRREKVRTIH